MLFIVFKKSTDPPTAKTPRASTEETPEPVKQIFI